MVSVNFMQYPSKLWLFYRLGPPDFYPQTPNCPEETLTKEYVQSGYKETVDGIEVRLGIKSVYDPLGPPPTC
jgi:hypothetical protein